jgi:hypothetical protein
VHSKDERDSMSSIINKHILSLKRSNTNYPRPVHTLKSKYN